MNITEEKERVASRRVSPAGQAEPHTNALHQESVSRVDGSEKRFEKGDVVEVRPWSDILRTLDDAGTLEGLPFMPEMLKLCGQKLRITKRLERTCEEIHGTMRRIRNVVFLEDFRCDGSAHGGCDKGCCFLWKDAWLRRPTSTQHLTSQSRDDVPAYPFNYAFPDGRYICQSTEMIHATSHLSRFDLGSYVRDLRAKTYSTRELFSAASRALFLRIRCMVLNKSHLSVEGTLTKTPTQTLNLEPGEWVRVKARDEIVRTLNREGKNRGLVFTVEMLPFCGRTFRVLKRVQRIIHEPSQKVMGLEGTVILENVTCDGCHSPRGGCPKDNYLYWREVWLERV
jgi:hypothetical protein